MKKRTATLFFVSIVLFCRAQPSDFDTRNIKKGHPLFEIAKSYFRSNPYNFYFSNFLDHLLNDPTLSGKIVKRRTDSSLFLLTGRYKDHNPFGFKIDRTEIRLAEKQIAPDDSLSTPDTLMIYQLLVYNSDGNIGLENVKKEFQKFNRKYRAIFSEETSDVKSGDSVIGAVSNFFLETSPFSPLAVSWAKLDEHQNLFTIILRIKVIQNLAEIPFDTGTQ